MEQKNVYEVGVNGNPSRPCHSVYWFFSSPSFITLLYFFRKKKKDLFDSTIRLDPQQITLCFCTTIYSCFFPFAFASLILFHLLLIRACSLVQNSFLLILPQSSRNVSISFVPAVPCPPPNPPSYSICFILINYYYYTVLYLFRCRPRDRYQSLETYR